MRTRKVADMFGKSDVKSGKATNLESEGLESKGLFSKLKEDHREVERLFDSLIKEGDSSTKELEDKFHELKSLLQTHTEAEEEMFYPLTEKDESTKELTLEAYQDHKVVKALLVEIDELHPDDELWSTKLQLLREAVELHFKEEEGELFALAKGVIPKGEQLRLGMLYANKKNAQKKENQYA